MPKPPVLNHLTGFTIPKAKLQYSLSTIASAQASSVFNMSRNIFNELRRRVFILAATIALIWTQFLHTNQTKRILSGDNCQPLSIVSHEGKIHGNLLYQYDQSVLEKHFIDNLEAFGLNIATITPTCPLIFNTSSPINNNMRIYFHELDEYNELIQRFEPIPYDLRKSIAPGEVNIEEVCNITQIHPNGLEGVFAYSQLGLPGLSKSTSVGIMEPLLPVFRSHKICINKPKYLMSMEYLVHDFYSMCKNLKRHSRTVFVDIPREF